LTGAPDERRSVTAAALAAAALIAHQVAGKATRDALFLSYFTVERLPFAITASAAVSIVAVAVFARAMARFTPGRVVPAALWTAMALLVAQWGLAGRYPRAAAVALYLHMAFFGATLVSGFWSLVNERWDPYAARRAMGRIGAGASLGGVMGGVLAAGLSSLLPAVAMLPLMAVLNGGALVALRGLGGATRRADEEDAPSLSGLSVIRAVPYLRDLAVLVALGALAEALLDYVLSAGAVGSYGRGGPLLAFFALFHTGVAVTGLLVQAAASRSSLERFGLAGTVALQPGGVVATAALGLLWPGLWTAIAARGLEAVLHGSLYRSGYELLYTPLPLVQKRATKAIVDVGFDKVGSVLGGLLTAALLAILPGAAVWASLAGAIAVSLACLAVLPRLHRGYVGSLEESLRSGSVRLAQEDVVDGTTRYTLARTGLALDRDALLREIEGMRGRTPARADEPLLAAVSALRGGDFAAARTTLAAGLTPALVGHALPLLGRDELAADAVRALRKVAPAATGQLVDALLDPSQPDAVRRRLPRVLRVCANPLAALGLRLGLSDRGFEVRYRCGQALAGIVEASPELAPPREVVFDEVKRELARLAARGPDDERRLEAVFTLLTLAVAREPVQIAYRAMRSQDRALRGTALEYLENVLPDDMRAALLPHLDAPRPAPRRRAAAEVEADLLRSGERLPAAPKRGDRSD
jgi:ATP:ADP antiporter, AAA family